MKCPGCQSDMRRLQLEAVLGSTVDIDVCSTCHAFWFDPFETLQLAPRATLELFRMIAEGDGHGSPIPATLRCPKCEARMKVSHDRQGNTPFEYWSCAGGHGRFTRFNDFLKEKKFIQPLTQQQIAELRKNVRMVNCSNCGAAVDLVNRSTCAHCGSPLVMLDREAMNELARQYQRAAERPIPVLPEVRTPEWQRNPLEMDLVAVGRWLRDLLL